MGYKYKYNAEEHTVTVLTEKGTEIAKSKNINSEEEAKKEFKQIVKDFENYQMM